MSPVQWHQGTYIALQHVEVVSQFMNHIADHVFAAAVGIIAARVDNIAPELQGAHTK